MDELFAMLVSQVVQVTILSLVILAVTKFCCKQRPHLAHVLWLLVLIKCVTPPVFSSPTGVSSWLMMERSDSSAVANSENFIDSPQPRILAPETVNDFQSLPVVTPKEIAEPIRTIKIPVAAAAPARTISQGNELVTEPRPRPRTAVSKRNTKQTPAITHLLAYFETLSWQQWVSMIWIAGVIMFLAASLFRLFRFKRWLRKQERIDDHSLAAQVHDLANRIGLRRKVRLNVVEAEFGPALMGLLKPTIVIPNSLVVDKTAEELEPIVGHELIHLRRGDTWWSVLQLMSCSLMWFHPLVWLASRNVTRESERCCDEETLANLECDRASYARMLVDILEQKSRLRIAPSSPGVRPSDVTSTRLEQIMNSETGKVRRTPRRVWMLAIAIAIIVLPGAAMVQSQESEKKLSRAMPPKTNSPLSGFRPSPVVPIVGSGKTLPPNRISDGAVSGSAIPQAETKSKPQNRIATPPSNSFTTGGEFSVFNPDAHLKRFGEEISGLAFTEEERAKIAKELEDRFWISANAQRHLKNCRKESLLLEVQYATVPQRLGNKIFGGRAAKESQANPGWEISQHELEKIAELDAFIEEIEKSNESTLTPVSAISFYEGEHPRPVAAKTEKKITLGVNQVSMLDPSRSKAKTIQTTEGLVVSAQLRNAKPETRVDVQISIDHLNVEQDRTLPLDTGAEPHKIETFTLDRLIESCSFLEPRAKSFVFCASRDDEPDMYHLAILNAKWKKPIVGNSEHLTLDRVLAIKKVVRKMRPNGTFAPSGDTVLLEAKVNEKEHVKIQGTVSKKTAENKTHPMSLMLRCGDLKEDQSFNSKIGLANKSTLSIEGDVESQRITTDSVSVKGKQFSFSNEVEGKFKASAKSGSLSFQRAGPIEDTLKLSLTEDAKLQFAGIEFKADSIQCVPNRIDAIGKVQINIPKISTTFFADRVVMNLQTLTFDFDGNAVVTRMVEADSFPFVVKSEHVGLSLVTGEMRTDLRYNSPARLGASTNGGFSNRIASLPSVSGGELFGIHQTNPLYSAPARSSSKLASPNDEVIYLGLPDSEFSALRTTGSVETVVENKVDRIIISDIPRPKQVPVRKIKPVIRDDTLVFKFDEVQLQMVGDYAFEFDVPSYLKGQYRTVKIEYSPNSQLK